MHGAWRDARGVWEITAATHSCGQAGERITGREALGRTNHWCSRRSRGVRGERITRAVESRDAFERTNALCAVQSRSRGVRVNESPVQPRVARRSGERMRCAVASLPGVGVLLAANTRDKSRDAENANVAAVGDPPGRFSLIDVARRTRRTRAHYCREQPARSPNVFSFVKKNYLLTRFRRRDC